MELADKALQILYDRGETYCSLGELAAEAGVSDGRAGEVLAELSGRGFAMERSPAHGVRLIRPIKLNAHLIERDLGTRRAGRSVICFEEVDSTNDVAWDSARRPGSDGLVILAEFQRKGRGRLGRKWLSPPGKNVLMSVLLADESWSLAHDALTIVAGLAVAEAVEESCGLVCELKWPNDVLLDGAKSAGVLVELRIESGRRHFVIGVGVNANAAPPRREIDVPAACLADQLGHPVERIDLIRSVLRRLDDWIRNIETRKLQELHSAWLARCGMINERVTVVAGGVKYVGRVIDVSPLEGLILCCDDGRTLHFPAASTTLA